MAARTLAELGYTRVESATLGFVRWKDSGFPMEKPPALSDAQRSRVFDGIGGISGGTF